MCYLVGQREPETLTALSASLLLFWAMALTPSLIMGPHRAECSSAVNRVQQDARGSMDNVLGHLQQHGCSTWAHTYSPPVPQ